MCTPSTSQQTVSSQCVFSCRVCVYKFSVCIPCQCGQTYWHVLYNLFPWSPNMHTENLGSKIIGSDESLLLFAETGTVCLCLNGLETQRGNYSVCRHSLLLCRNLCQKQLNWLLFCGLAFGNLKNEFYPALDFNPPQLTRDMYWDCYSVYTIMQCVCCHWRQLFLSLSESEYGNFFLNNFSVTHANSYHTYYTHAYTSSLYMQTRTQAVGTCKCVHKQLLHAHAYTRTYYTLTCMYIGI